jgi:hypothetical protein
MADERPQHDALINWPSARRDADENEQLVATTLMRAGVAMKP